MRTLPEVLVLMHQTFDRLAMKPCLVLMRAKRIFQRRSIGGYTRRGWIILYQSKLSFDGIFFEEKIEFSSNCSKEKRIFIGKLIQLDVANGSSYDSSLSFRSRKE